MEYYRIKIIIDGKLYELKSYGCIRTVLISKDNEVINTSLEEFKNKLGLGLSLDDLEKFYRGPDEKGYFSYDYMAIRNEYGIAIAQSLLNLRVDEKEVLEAPERVKEVEESEKPYDFTEKPNHYNGHKIRINGELKEYETIDLIESVIGRVSDFMPADASYLFGNAVKYMDRCGVKPDAGKTINDKAVEDIDKMINYLVRCRNIIKEGKHSWDK